MSRIFISYRRDDSLGHVGWLRSLLIQRFGADQVFGDIETIPTDVDFVEAIKAAVESCDAILVIIGPRWLTVTDQQGQRRLDNPEDFVRIEIATALERNIRVIPVLVQDAHMPRSNELPTAIAKLARRNSIGLRDSSWDYDVGRLINALEYLLSQQPPQERPSTTAPDTSINPTSSSDSPQVTFEKDAPEILRSTTSDQQVIRGHIFISYGSKDISFVLPLATSLKNCGVPVWFDQWNIRKGENYDRAITRGILTCSQLLVVLSPASVESDEVQTEYFLALQKRKPVVPVLYQDCDIPRRLLLLQYIDFRNRKADDREGLEEILSTLRTQDEEI